MHVAFGKAMDFDGGQYGQAILSRYPLTDIKIHPLPFTQGCEPRCALAAHFQLSDTGPDVVFADTHLEHAKAAVRLCQANKLNPLLVAREPATHDFGWGLQRCSRESDDPGTGTILAGYDYDTS